METPRAVEYQRTERLIAQLTLILGAFAAAGACWLFSVRVGGGIFVGAVLAWLNFRWLEGAMDGLVRASTASADSGEARLPLGSVFRLIARYALIAGVVYVTFSVFKVPVLSMLVGLCALGVATISASLFEILSPAGQ